MQSHGAIYGWFFFFNDTATTEIYTYGHTLSLHDALPISRDCCPPPPAATCRPSWKRFPPPSAIRSGRSPRSSAAPRFPRSLPFSTIRSEEHTSELQSLMRISYAVFCLKKKNTYNTSHTPKNK